MSFVEDIRGALNWALKLCANESSATKPRTKRLKLEKSKPISITSSLPVKRVFTKPRVSEMPRVKYDGDLEPVLRKRRRKTPPKRRLTLDLTLRNYQQRFIESDEQRVYLSPSNGVHTQPDEPKRKVTPLTHNPFTGELISLT
jgi:hypothetical protein